MKQMIVRKEKEEHQERYWQAFSHVEFIARGEGELLNSGGMDYTTQE